MEYYSTIKENETIPFTAMWMNLEIPNGSQVRQKEKTNTSFPGETQFNTEEKKNFFPCDENFYG